MCHVCTVPVIIERELSFVHVIGQFVCEYSASASDSLTTTNCRSESLYVYRVPLECGQPARLGTATLRPIGFHHFSKHRVVPRLACRVSMPIVLLASRREARQRHYIHNPCSCFCSVLFCSLRGKRIGKQKNNHACRL